MFYITFYTFILNLRRIVISHLMHSNQASTVSYFTGNSDLLRVHYIVLPLVGYYYRNYTTQLQRRQDNRRLFN